MFRARKGKTLKWPSSTSVDLISWRQWIMKHEDKLPEDGDASEINVRISYSKCKLDERLAKPHLKKVATKLELRILHCSTEVKMEAVVEFTILLLWAHVVHWTGWERPRLASIPCERRIDLGLEVTVKVMPSC